MTRFALTFATLLTASPAFACDSYDAVVAAVGADDMDGATALYEVIAVDAACGDDLREWVGDYLARKHFAMSLGTADPVARKTELETALRYEKHWRSFAGLGHLAWEAKDYDTAAMQYQLAINELIEGDPTHAAETSEIAQVYELASAAMALADAPVEMPKTRSGGAGGVFATSIRGFEVEEVPLPITFEYNSTTFDAAGETYAQALAAHLLQLAPARVNLGGHTDPVGSDAYNMALSEDRAEALEAYLRANGYAGEITVTGFGESRLPPAPPGIAEGSEEHYRIARRVSFGLE